MRPVLHGDLVTVARALLAVPKPQRGPLCQQIFQEADFADRYRKRFGRPHPKWGSGSLMSAALQRTVVNEPRLNHRGYCRCLTLVLSHLAKRHQLGSRRRLRRDH